MSSWTHLVRFVAFEDGQVHLGQLVDPTRDVGLDSINEVPVYAFEIEGSIYNGWVTEKALQVRKVRQTPCFPRKRYMYILTRIYLQLLSPIVPQECPYIRCLGLNYKLHAKVHYHSTSQPFSLESGKPTHTIIGSRHGNSDRPSLFHETSDRNRQSAC